MMLPIAALLTGYSIPAPAQQKPTAKAAARKKMDFSMLTSFKDSLFDLQGAVVAGVNRQDYQHQLQIAAAESVKAEDRLSEWEAIPPVTPVTNAMRACYRSYGSALFYYQWAATKWDVLIDLRKEKWDEGHAERVSKAEGDLREGWSKADSRLAS
jgi:hypothetical protein